MKILATYSIKGGVGKTTAAVNLAYEASLTGARTLLWDLDPQGAATFFLKGRPKLKGGAERLIAGSRDLVESIQETDHVGLHLVGADVSLRHLDLFLDDAKRPTRRLAKILRPLSDQYDIVLLDCAPGLTLTSESVFTAVDALLVPTIPSPLSFRTLEQLQLFMDQHGDPEGAPLIAPFVSMYDRRRKLHREIVAELLDGRPALLPTLIPSAAIIEQMGVECGPVATYAPHSPAAAAFHDLWLDVAAVIAN